MIAPRPPLRIWPAALVLAAGLAGVTVDRPRTASPRAVVCRIEFLAADTPRRALRSPPPRRPEAPRVREWRAQRCQHGRPRCGNESPAERRLLDAEWEEACRRRDLVARCPPDKPLC